jgi:glycine/D-amino acid oxidase-like deaminating enzyme
VDARLAGSGEKILTVCSGDTQDEIAADYVINATYANVNQLARWLGLPVEPLRFDLCEMLVLELDLPAVAVTILDGPFTSLVGTGEPREFLLSHIHESILRSDITANGLPPDWSGWTSNRENLLRHCSRYIPILSHAKILESRFAIRAVRALTDDYDGRPTVLRALGYGCWSVLGGKIVTSVSTAHTAIIIPPKQN